MLLARPISGASDSAENEAVFGNPMTARLIAVPHKRLRHRHYPGVYHIGEV